MLIGSIEWEEPWALVSETVKGGELLNYQARAWAFLYLSGWYSVFPEHINLSPNHYWFSAINCHLSSTHYVRLAEYTIKNKIASAHKAGCVNCSRSGIGAQKREMVFLGEEEKWTGKITCRG